MHIDMNRASLLRKLARYIQDDVLNTSYCWYGKLATMARTVTEMSMFGAEEGQWF